MVGSIYIKRARSFRPAAPSTMSNTGTTTTSEPLPPEESRRVYLNRARVVGHGTVFRGDVTQLLEKLPRTDADVHVYMTGPFTKPEKVLAVEPIRCRVESVRQLWTQMITYNKPLLEHVSSELDEDAMTALRESLVDIDVENESGGGDVELNEEEQTDRPQPSSASSGLDADSSSRVVSFIGTNLLVNDHGSSNNDFDTVVEPVAADVSTNEPNEADMQPAALLDNDDERSSFIEESGDLADCDGRDDEHGEEKGHHTTDDPIIEELANLEAIAHRVRLKDYP